MIESCWLASESGERLNVVIAGDPVRWCFTVRFDAPVVSPVFSMMLKTRDGEAVFGTDSSRVGGAPEAAVAGQTYVAEFLIDTHLAPDQYFLNCGVRRDTVDDSVFLSRRIDAATLKVSSSEQSSSLVGAADLRARLSVTPQTQRQWSGERALDKSPIFIHSMLRSGSTYLFARARARRPVLLLRTDARARGLGRC